MTARRRRGGLFKPRVSAGPVEGGLEGSKTLGPSGIFHLLNLFWRCFNHRMVQAENLFASSVRESPGEKESAGGQFSASSILERPGNGGELHSHRSTAMAPAAMYKSDAN